MNGRKQWSAWLQNASMLIYILWLMLPAVQVRLKAATGAMALLVFAVGVLLDGETLLRHWKAFVPRVLCVAALPLLLLFFLNRGGSEPVGYYAQQVMFWFPLLWCAHTLQTGDKPAYRFVFLAMLLAFMVTILTTAGWLIEGMLREGGKVFAYARSLGSGVEGRQDYLNELMGRNIGGYGFVYAGVFALPLTFFLAGGRGWRRWAFSALYALQLLMIVLSQYTYAIVFAAAITGAELLGLLFRKIFRRMSAGVSLLCAVPVLALVFLLRIPLVTGLTSLAEALRFENIAFSFNQLLAALGGGGIAEGSRLEAYATSWNSFVSSPVFGGIFSGQARLGMHSEVLDSLAALGIAGTLAFLAAVWVIGRGVGKGLSKSPALPHLILQWAAFIAFMAVGTVFYAREISLTICLCIAFAVWTGRQQSGIMEQM
ncbi:MAG: hypothetical protein ABIG45_09750 [Bacillota bacterium]